jgi:uncharacterized protein (DUF433 family)
MKTIYRKYFSRSPGVCHDQLVYRGTRIPVSLTLQMLEGGDSVDDILRGYPSLTRKSIQAAIRAASEAVENVR